MYGGLADFEVKWLANITNPKMRRASRAKCVCGTPRICLPEPRLSQVMRHLACSRDGIFSRDRLRHGREEHHHGQHDFDPSLR